MLALGSNPFKHELVSEEKVFFKGIGNPAIFGTGVISTMAD